MTSPVIMTFDDLKGKVTPAVRSEGSTCSHLLEIDHLTIYEV